jgi:hypothetical protein
VALVVVEVADAFHELLVDIRGAGADATVEDVSLDPREPVRDLIEPGLIRGRVMHVDVAMLGQERLDKQGLVVALAGAVDMNLAPWGRLAAIS